jgi:uncharacterized membrane protein
MAAPKQARPAGTPSRPGGGKARDKGTRGGRPEPQPPAPHARAGPAPRQGTAPRQGNGQQGTGQMSRKTTPAAGRGAVPAARGAVPAAPAVPDVRIAPLWFRLTTLVLAVGGLGVSIYLTIAHYNTTLTLACPATSHINCEKVTTSAQSVVFGIPVAVLGLAFYVFMVAATTPWAWRSQWPPLRWARLGSVIVGMVFVLYLIYTEIFTLNLTICLWCTSVHVLTFVLFGLVVFAAVAGYGTAAADETAQAQPRR